MEFKYRGVTYDRETPELRAKAQRMTSKYRGAFCHVLRVELPLLKKQTPTLKYRGTTYKKDLSIQQDLASISLIYRELIHS